MCIQDFYHPILLLIQNTIITTTIIVGCFLLSNRQISSLLTHPVSKCIKLKTTFLQRTIMKNMNYFNNQPKSNDSQVKTSVDVGFQRSRASSNLGHT